MTDSNGKNVVKFCGNCGKKLIEQASFCAYCGFSIGIRKSEQNQTQEIGYTSETFRDQTFSISHEKPGVPTTPYLEKKIQPRPFFTNFRGAILTPKSDLPLIANIPNISQPLILNLIIGFLSGLAMFVMLTKVKITFSSAFFDSLVSDFGSTPFTANELEQMLIISTPFFAPIETLVRWLIYTIILWVLFTIFASDLASHDRNFKKMATITGWAQIPMILQQVTSILLYTFFLTDGEIVYQSMTEISIVVGGEIPGLLNLMVQGIQIFLLLWSVLLIYYAVKSFGSLRMNPATISAIYGVILFVLTILLSYPLV